MFEGDYRDLSKAIRTMRKAAKLSQRQLAERVDVRRETIVEYERGDYSPSADILVSMARVCGVRVVLRLEVVGPPPPPSTRVPAARRLIDR